MASKSETFTMNGNEYLRSMISKYQRDSSQAVALSHQIYPTVKVWAGKHLVECIWSGSIAKGTTVSLSSDADVFISLSSTTPDTLSDIYGSLSNVLTGAGYTIRKQNVSIRVLSTRAVVDYTPGKRQSPQGYDHSIFKSKLRTWTKTNVKTHISHITGSGRGNEIKLTKIWRELNRIEFPSFYLELAVIDCLSGAYLDDLANNLWKILTFLAGPFLERVYYDPANANNRVSDDLSVS